ncbi:hypothetical protein [Lactococcus termiticola]|uniref:Uncharacterized protein n=1 Tax=Lactococcus termiticola TaxID=2169526 RepID=A0A2R5HED7_9LACT|nr:hypothetical protein [Lactococcus termiticola]GBG96437.1 hypothetical protein NtB2_00549 [Lactococcus termiticola]
MSKPLFEHHRTPAKFFDRLYSLLFLPGLLTLIILMIFAVLYILSGHLPE